MHLSLCGGCAAFNPPPGEVGFERRALSETDAGVKVSVVALSDNEASRATGVKLARPGIQPVWVKIENAVLLVAIAKPQAIRQGAIEWTVIIAIWVVIVGNLDSLLRPLLIARGGGDLPLILVLLGVIGGAMAFGLIGLFLGPTLLAIGYSMIDEWSSAKLPLDGEGKSDLPTRTDAAQKL